MGPWGGLSLDKKVSTSGSTELRVYRETRLSVRDWVVGWGVGVQRIFCVVLLVRVFEITHDHSLDFGNQLR